MTLVLKGHTHICILLGENYMPILNIALQHFLHLECLIERVPSIHSLCIIIIYS